MSVKITELPILDSLADNDIVAGVDVSGNVTSKIEMSTLKNYIDTNTQYTAGTNIDITNNVISAPDVYNKDEMDNQIEELQNEVESLSTIFNAFPTESGEGESFTLDDTAEVKFKKFDLKGNTSQTTYSGKNLLPNDRGTKTVNGVTFTKNSDGTYLVNGTASADVSEAICDDFIAMSGTWRMLGCPSGGSSSTYMLSAYVGYWGEGSPNIDTGNGTNITYTGNVKVRFFIKSGTTCNNLIFKPMLTTDTTATINNFEPYVGGTASPNPTYPQDIHIVSGDNTINVESKNLLDEKGLLNVTFITGVYKYAKANFKGNRTLYFKAQLKSGKTALSGLYVALANYGSNPNAGTSAFSIRNGAVQNSGISNDFTGMEDLYISFYPTSYTWEEIINTYDLWVSTSDNTYSEYQGQVEYQVNLGVKNLFDKDNVNYLNDVFIGGTGTITSGSGNTSIYIKCNANTTYTIKKEVDNVFRAGTTQNVPIVGATTNDYKDNASGSEITLTTSSNANYLVVFLRNNSSSKTLETIINSLQITTGDHIQQISTTPIELCKIGTYEDYFVRNSGKNILPQDKYIASTTKNGITFTNNGDGTFNLVGTASANTTMEIIPNGSLQLEANQPYYLYSSVPYNGTTFNMSIPMTDDGATKFLLANGTYTPTTTPTNVRLQFYIASGQSIKAQNIKLMLVKGTTSPEYYEPFGNEGKWCKYNAIVSITLDGSESGWANMYLNNQGLGTITVNLDNLVYQSNNSGICNYFIYKWVYNNPKPCFYVYNEGNIGRIMFITQFTTKQDFITWLSTHNTQVKYVPSSPYLSLIENETLISQLDKIEKALAKQGQTNISQVSNDKPFILDVTAIKSLQSVLDRIELLES